MTARGSGLGKLETGAGLDGGVSGGVVRAEAGEGQKGRKGQRLGLNARTGVGCGAEGQSGTGSSSGPGSHCPSSQSGFMAGSLESSRQTSPVAWRSTRPLRQD